MTVLCDREITELAHAGMIAPFATGEHRPGVISYGVTSFGYDMRVADEWTTFRTYSNVDPKNPSLWRVDDAALDDWPIPGWIAPGRFVLCRSIETFHLPDDVFGLVVGKSTYARCGLIVNCTPMEPGWRGQLTIELHNASQHSIRVYANEGIAQVVFFRGNRPAITYADKQGKYQDQVGVTLPVVR